MMTDHSGTDGRGVEVRAGYSPSEFHATQRVADATHACIVAETWRVSLIAAGLRELPAGTVGDGSDDWRLDNQHIAHIDISKHRTLVLPVRRSRQVGLRLLGSPVGAPRDINTAARASSMHL